MMLRSLALLATALVLAAPSLATALEPAAEAAARANEVNQTYCGDAYSLDVTLAADSTMRVAETWSQVDHVYQDTSVPYLLFWRGVLAQCLGRPENAYEDLEAFIETQEQEGGYADLVRQAKVRLRRLGRKRQLGDGPAARWLRDRHVIEASVGYSVGLVIQRQVCTDEPVEGEPFAPLDGGCLGQEFPLWKNGVMGQLAGLDAAVAVYPVSVLGLGVRFGAGVTTESQLGVAKDGLLPTQVGPLWTMLAGPVLRLQKPVSSGARGVRAQIMPGLHVRHERLSPLAGAMNLESVGLIPAGTYGWTRPGFATWFDLTVELNRVAALRFGGEGGVAAPTEAPDLTEVVAPSGRVLRMPDPLDLGAAGFAGGHLGVLIALGKGTTAFSPTIRFCWQTSNLRFPEPVGDEVDGGVSSKGEPLDAKVYSTRQDLYSITLDLTFRIGVPRK